MSLQKNLVDCQLAPNGITDTRVLAAYLHLDRAAFVPTAQARQAYIDAALPVGYATICPPLVEARLIQAAELTPTDRVLVIGAGGGAVAGIAALMARAVVFASGNSEATNFNATAFLRLGLTNVTVATQLPADINDFSVIIVVGAVDAIPDTLPKSARIVAVCKDSLGVSQNNIWRGISQNLAPRLQDPIVKPMQKGFVF